MKGKLYLLPTTLGGESVNDIIPEEVQKITKEMRIFAVEDLKSARRYLRKLDRTFPIDDSKFYIVNKSTKQEELFPIISKLKQGENVGILSEAGCPGIADPGASLVALAHENGIHIQPLVGPSSILLALISSGFNGQNFTFHGYLPKERKDRIYKLKTIEGDARKSGSTHIFMDTPFRNMNVLDDVLNELTDVTEVCIALNLTLYNQRVQTMAVKDWRENAFDLAKMPCIFLIGNSQK